jgi:2-polyprenyl-3-methyl-5-hydroxy-6-metoxy-1,4-benzoquinol methylase
MSNIKIKYFNMLMKEWVSLSLKKKIFSKIISCPVCEKKKFTFLFHKINFRFVICNNCTHVFINPYLKKKIIIKHFSLSKTWDVWSNKVLQQKKQKSVENEKYRNGVNFLKKIKKRNLSILDIGSSSGSFISIAIKNSWNIEGIEPSRTCYKFIKKKFNCKIYNSTFEDAKITKQYDVITCWASFEYSINPKLFINKVIQCLKPRGKLILYISGNSKSLVMRILREKCIGYIFNRMNYFNPESLHLLLKKKFNKKLIKSELDNIDIINNHLNYRDPYIKKKDLRNYKFFSKKNILKNLMGYKFLAIYEKK